VLAWSDPKTTSVGWPARQVQEGRYPRGHKGEFDSHEFRAGHAIERIPSEGWGQAVHLTPIPFACLNKLGKR